MFRITFNKPAYDTFFAGEEARGLRIKIADGHIAFQPVQESRGDDIVAVDPRGRGGVEIRIEGKLEDEVLAALQNHHSPFFLLARQSHWIVPAAWVPPTDSPDGKMPEPPRFKPHLRVWARDNAAISTDILSQLLTTDSTNFAQEMAEAHDTIARFKGKSLSQVPKELAEARRKIALLDNMARRFLPHYDRLLRAYADIGEILGDRVNEAPSFRRIDGLTEAPALKSAKSVAQPKSASSTVKQTAPVGRGRRAASRSHVETDQESEKIASKAAKQLGLDLDKPKKVPARAKVALKRRRAA